MKDKILNVLGISCVAFTLGVFAGERSKGGFFRSWYGDETAIYVGDKVLFTSDSGVPNNCDKMTVLGLQAIEDKNVAWILLENCQWGEVRVRLGAETVNVKYLVKEKKE